MFSARPRSGGLLALTASVLVLLLTATGLMLLPAATTLGSASAATTPISSGHLDWGIKESWRTYIGAPGTTLAGGATRNADGTFRFPVKTGTYDDATRTTVIAFDGSARFQAHYGLIVPDGYALDSQWSNLELTIGPSEQVLRGDYSGVPRTDPGGPFEVSEHVVLAKLDITTGETSFDGGTSTWSDLFAVAGQGFTLYTEGTVIDPVSLTYAGPGGVPDLGEHWATQGAPVLEEEARWVSANAGSTRNLAGFYFSERDDVVQVAEIRNAGMPSAVFTLSARDAQTLQPVGQSVTKDTTTGGTKYARTAFDPATDTTFHITGWEGAGKLTTNVYASTWDSDTSSYSTVTVGQLPDSLNTSNVVQVAGMVWNAREGELAVLARTAGADVYSNYRLYRFSHDDEGWQRAISDLTLPSDGEYADATAESNALGDVGTQQTDGPTMGVARDGSYVVASQTGFFSFADGHRVYAEASHISIGDGGAAVVEFIDGTRGSRATTGGTYYGFASIVEGARDDEGGAPLWLHNAGQAMDGFVQVDVVDGAAETIGDIVQADVDASPPSLTSTFGRLVGTDQTHGYTWVADLNDPQARNLRAYDDGAVVSTMAYPEIRPLGRGYGDLQAAEDGSLYVGITDAATGRNGIALLRFQGITAEVETQPQSTSVELAADEASRAVDLTSTATPGEPAATRQWQVRPVGESRFSDIPGAIDETLSVSARPGMDGTQYRAVYTNVAGSVVSDVATLSVDYAPRVVVDVRDQTVTEGADATFLAGFDGFPEPTFTWQRRVDGFWTNIDADDDSYAISDASLTVKDSIVEQSGALFRVRARNSVATTYSRAARLTVDAAVTIPAGGLDLTGVVLEWTGSEELQVAPPFGGVNYVSAGVSDGTQATYRADDGAASIWQVAPGGAQTRATYATRSAHLGTGGHQLVRLGAGKAHLDPDGSGTVDWRGSWSVNFYGGLVPFTVTDPVLTVDEDGTGTLTGDLSGYASAMENPTEKTVLTPVPDVVVATFRDVELEPSGVITVKPDYAGVAIDVPDGQAAQVTTNPGWGAWPQQFVDFHFQSGLSSYWYSSGGAADPHKVPSTFAVDFTDAVDDPGTVVTKAASTTTVTAGAVAYGQPGTVSVRVAAAPPASGTPSGTVTVTIGGKPATGTLVAGGARIAVPRGLKPGNHPVVAAYAGDATTAASSGSDAVRITKARPRVSLKVAKRKVSPERRAAVKVVATIPGRQVVAIGKVVVRDGRRIVATKRLTAASKGAISIRLPRLAKGKHRLTATLVASALHAAASSRRSTLRVG